MSTDISLRYLLFGEDKSASSTVGKVGKSFGKLGSYVGGEFGEILSKAGEGIDHIGEHAQSMGAKITGVGAIVGGLGVALQMAGSREKQGAEQLNAAIDASGHSHEDYAEEIEKTIKANEKFGFGAADTQQALAKLTAATNDPKKALDDMGVAANLAASQHISLADASKMLARVQSGTGGKVLAQYGIQMDHTKTKTEAGRLALEELSKKLNGQAAASVDSFGGKIKVAQTKIGDMTASIGQKLGPALTIAGPLLMGVGTVLEIFKARQLAAAAATDAEAASESRGIIVKGVGLVRTVAMTVATTAWSAAQWALNVALNANPIALVIIGIVALIAVIILAWKHSETFRKVVTAAFSAIGNAVGATVGFIKAHWGLILAILTGPVGLAVRWVTQHWGGIVSFFKSMPGKIGAVMGGVVGVLTSPFRAAFNAIADLWNGTVGQLSFHIPSWVPKIGGNGFSMPKLPHLYMGGIARHRMIAEIGDRGPEAVVPLSAGNPGLGGGQVIHLHVELSPLVTNKAQAGREIIDAMIEAQKGSQNALPIRVTRAVAVG